MNKDKLTQLKLKVANLTLLESHLRQNWLNTHTALEETIEQLKKAEKEVVRNENLKREHDN